MITVVGSFNMDLFIETERFARPGETLSGKNFRRAPGGKGANQAFAIARMGESAAIIGAVGADSFGDEMLHNLSTAGVNTESVARRPDAASGTALVTLDASGQNTIIVANGANDTLTGEDVTRHKNLFQKSRALVVQLETPPTSVEAALRLAHDCGIPAFLNPAPYFPVPDSLLALCDWIIPNEFEAAKLSGIEVRHEKDAAWAAKSIRLRSGCPNIIVTLGAHGVWLDTPKNKIHIPGFKVGAVDTVGAGDTFIGAFITKLIAGANETDAARFGCAAAAIAVTRRGAQAGIPTRDEVEAFLEQT